MAQIQAHEDLGETNSHPQVVTDLTNQAHATERLFREQQRLGDKSLAWREQYTKAGVNLDFRWTTNTFL